MTTRPGFVALVESAPCEAGADVRTALVERLVQAGLRDLVVAGGDELAGGDGSPLSDLVRHPEVRYSVRVDDLASLEGSLSAGATEIAVTAPGCDPQARPTRGGNVEDGLRRLEPMALLAADHGVRLRGHLIGVIGTGGPGTVDATAVAAACMEMLNLGCFEVSLDGTTGTGSLPAWRTLWETCAARVGPDRLAVRLRGDWPAALDCLDALLPLGLQTVDTSVGGLGRGNPLGTEDVASHLHAQGVATGTCCDRLVETAWWLGSHLGRAPVSRLARARGQRRRD